MADSDVLVDPWDLGDFIGPVTVKPDPSTAMSDAEWQRLYGSIIPENFVDAIARAMGENQWDLSTVTGPSSVVGPSGGGLELLDRVTGQRVTLAQAFAQPNLTQADVEGLLFLAQQRRGGWDLGTIEALGGDVGQSTATATPTQGTSFLQSLLTTLGSTSLKDIGGLLVGAAGIGGLTAAIVGMTRNANGTGTIRLPDNRTVTLSPEERQLLDLAVTQAKQQAGISNLTLPALASAAEAAAPDIMRLIRTGTQTAAAQAGAQGVVTGAANTAVAGAAPDLFAGDLTSARALQTGVQTPAIRNLSDLVRLDQPTAAERFSGQVGTAADQRILEMIQNPEGIYALAQDRLRRGLEGTLPVNPRLARTISEDREKLLGRMGAELGPGYATSTPGMRTRNEFEQFARESEEADIRQQITQAQNVAQGQTGIQAQNLSAFSPLALGRLTFDEEARQRRFGRAHTGAGGVGQGTQTIANIFGLGQTGGPSSSGTVATLLGERPGSLALQNLSQLAGIGNAQATNQFTAAQLEALMRAQANRDLTVGGGHLFGMAASPFFDAFAQSLFK